MNVLIRPFISPEGYGWVFFGYFTVAVKEGIFKKKKATVNGVTDQITRETSQYSCKQEDNSQRKQHVLLCTLGTRLCAGCVWEIHLSSGKWKQV